MKKANLLKKLNLLNTILLYIATLPFLGLISKKFSFSIQEYVLWILAILAGASTIYKKDFIRLKYGGVIGFFVFSLIVSCVLSDKPMTHILGLENGWLGVLTIASIILVAYYIAPRLQESHFKLYFYYAAIVGVISLVLDPLTLLSNSERSNDLFSSSVVLAIILGGGYICGVKQMLEKNPKTYEFVFMLIIFLAIFATKTRAVFVVVVIASVFVIAKHIKTVIVGLNKQKTEKVLILAVIFGLLTTLLAAIISTSSGRLIDVPNYRYGVSYRLELVKDTGSLLWRMPAWGLGPGGIENNFNKFEKFSAEMEARYEKDVIIESSHNLILDYFLQYGWISGLLLLIICILTLYYSGRLIIIGKHKLPAVLFLFILLQQMVTVSVLITELFFWVSLILVWYYYNQSIKSSHRSIRGVNIALAILSLAIVVTLILMDLFIAPARLSSNFGFPLATTKSQLKKGSKSSVETGVWAYEARENMHAGYMGADIFAEQGTPVVASKAGFVIKTRDDGCDGEGQFPNIYIRGIDGLIYHYAHLASGSIQIAPGDYVGKGQKVGEVGSSDCASGTPPHLHYDVSRWYLARSRRDENFKNINYLNVQPILSNAYYGLSL